MCFVYVLASLLGRYPFGKVSGASIFIFLFLPLIVLALDLGTYTGVWRMTAMS